jgi:hypothetical protein
VLFNDTTLPKNSCCWFVYCTPVCALQHRRCRISVVLRSAHFNDTTRRTPVCALQ